MTQNEMSKTDFRTAAHALQIHIGRMLDETERRQGRGDTAGATEAFRQVTDARHAFHAIVALI